MPQLLPSDQDRTALLAEVERFASRSVEPCVARPERPMDEAALAGLLGEAEEIGLCGADREPSGLGAWEELDDARGPVATLEVLGRIARSSASIALAVHQRALARALLRRAGIDAATASAAIAPEGSHGLGRTAFARLLRGAALDAEDRAHLAHIYAAAASRVLPLEPGARALLVPVLAPGDVIEWQLHRRDDLELTEERNAHGLDELRVVTARAKASAWHVTDLGPAWRALACTFFAAHQLALVAIARGAVERAHALARRYASQRRQGGTSIDRHAAILALLGRSRATLRSVGERLEARGARSLDDPDAIGAALALRLDAQPALVDAANAALQVFGGIGYMRETGLEKVLRDVNCLRVMAGTPIELALIVAELERLDG